MNTSTAVATKQKVCLIVGAGEATGSAIVGGKAALRALAQSMAREFGPQGLHIAHVVVDGAIDSERVRRTQPERVFATRG